MARLNCVTILAPAKLNLALDVVGLLPGGYHDLDMTMQAITLYELSLIHILRTVTMGISLLDCIDPDPKKACENIYNKITTKAANLVPTVCLLYTSRCV